MQHAFKMINLAFKFMSFDRFINFEIVKNVYSHQLMTILRLW